MDASYLHVFPYSERDDTEAVNILPKVRFEKIMKRSQVLHDLSRKKKYIFNKQNIGSLRQVLIESYKEGFLSGLTENYIRVITEGKSNEVNTIIPLQMRDIHQDKMTGHRII